MPELDVQEPHSPPVAIADAARRPADEVLKQLGSGAGGLSSGEAAKRLAGLGPNAVRTHQASGWSVLGRQLRSPILILLFITAGLSLFLGDATNAVVIGVILLVSVGLGFSNEFRAERAAEACTRGSRTARWLSATGPPAKSTSPPWCRATSCIWGSVRSSPPTCGC
ncbi:cation-transporting P-type ATPase [Pseudarthrobacter sp. H2]|uniref:cation-transporting P-type ATPase n=1 Tax=Pseudarthrobacter sp. H2 TaxID=3418415 RepID=UPI003CEDD7C6